MTDKRALRFTGDASEQLLIPWDAGAAGHHPETHRLAYPPCPTGVRRHQCDRHKTLARMGQAMRISQEARNKR